MPKGNQIVLINYSQPFGWPDVMVVGINFDGTGRFRALEKGGDIDRATHWMLLPDPPI